MTKHTDKKREPGTVLPFWDGTSELRQVQDLKPDTRNARRHSERNLQAIQESLQQFGQVQPIVIDRLGNVIGGNGTLEVAKRLGWTEIETVTFTGNENQAKALAIALNRTAELAVWDLQQLEATIVDLADQGFQPIQLGFNDMDLDTLFPPSPAQAPEPYRPAAPDIEHTSREPDQPPAQYAIMFDDEGQKKRFMGWLRRLKKEFPDAETVAARIDAHIGVHDE